MLRDECGLVAYSSSPSGWTNPFRENAAGGCTAGGKTAARPP